MTYKFRFLENKIQDSVQRYAVVNVVGPRQCGKSSMLQQLFPDWNYFSLDNYDHYRLVLSDTFGFFDRYPERVIIDEAQLLPELCSVLDQFTRTGSPKVSHIILISSTRLRHSGKTELKGADLKVSALKQSGLKQSESTSSKIRNNELKDSRLGSLESKSSEPGNSKLKNSKPGHFNLKNSKSANFSLNNSKSANFSLDNSKPGGLKSAELRNFGLHKSVSTQSGEIPVIELWPLKMAEYYSLEPPQIYEKILKVQTQPEDFLRLKGTLTLQEVYEHWLYGGFPEPRINCRDNKKFQTFWLNEYLKTHLRIDIQNQFPRLNYQKFYLFIAASLQHSGRLINHSRVARSLELSSVSVRQYFEILQQTAVWRGLNSFQESTTKTLKKAPKGYFRDSGVLNHHLRISEINQLLVHPQAEIGFESFAVEELIRGIQFNSEQSCNFTHLKTKDGSEISLIIEDSQRLIPILIQLGRKVDKRKLRAIQDFVQENNCNYGLLVNTASTVEVLDGKIVQIPVNCI